MPASDLAPCGHGAFGTCCCTCTFQMIAKPRCHHIGGVGECGDKLHNKSGALGALGGQAVDETTEYVCTVFAKCSGVVMTDWMQHGMCEGYWPRDKDES